MIRRRSIQTIFSAAVMLAAATPAWAEGVLVFGGTGLLGSEIVKQLANAGETQITVFARPTSDRSRLDGIDVDYVVGDVLNDDEVEAAFKSNDFRLAINALNLDYGTENWTFYQDGLASMVKWAEKTGVDRIVFHSATGAGDSAGLLRADLPEDSRKRYADRTRAEEILAEADVEYAVLRTYIVRPETEPATGKAFVSTDHTVTGSVSRADLAILTLYCSDGPRCRNQILHASTNDDWTFQRPE